MSSRFAARAASTVPTRGSLEEYRDHVATLVDLAHERGREAGRREAVEIAARHGADSDLLRALDADGATVEPQTTDSDHR